VKRTRQKSPQTKPRKSQRTNASSLVKAIFAETRSKPFQKYLSSLLIELCRIDTTPRTDVSKMGQAEDRCFRIIERELSALQYPGAQLSRRAINPGIQTHPNYSLLHFTKTAERPEGLPPERVYQGRSNLLYYLPGRSMNGRGQSIALNAHIDVVAPYFPPRYRPPLVFGRGSCDDKGPVVGIVAALKVLSSVMAPQELCWNKNVLAMFVVEEETGGNGSLSLAMDRDLRKLYDSILVSECTGLKLHPANRGAVWYRAALRPPAGTSAFEMFAFINEEMEKEGVAIRAESRHPLFPQRPVQTCHGIIGAFGEHPSRICGEMCFSVRFERKPAPATLQLLEDTLKAGLDSYTGLYGDKTKIIDSATGGPMVVRHYDLKLDQKTVVLRVYGAAGHMGSIRERDGAITKAAHLIRSLVSSKRRFESIGAPFVLGLGRQQPTGENPVLVLEGGQGFVPTHTITEVMNRLEQAARRGADNYLSRLGIGVSGKDVVKVTYEKLHNVAFDGDPSSAAMQRAIKAARACGLWKDEPLLGWTVSCDARLFATEYPDMPVLTFGPGQLMHAHSDHEQINVEEIRAAAEFLAVFLLLQTATIARP
jgi:acetylornithine deacetylase/succinyl-diaminopimelate desuccinylase-like protein